MGHSRPLFIPFCLFYKQSIGNNCSIKVDDDWIRTQVLWYWKWLRHNHCIVLFILQIFTMIDVKNNAFNSTHRDSNLQPNNRKSPHITTRPEPLLLQRYKHFKANWYNCQELTKSKKLFLLPRPLQNCRGKFFNQNIM